MKRSISNSVIYSTLAGLTFLAMNIGAVSANAPAASPTSMRVDSTQRLVLSRRSKIGFAETRSGVVPLRRSVLVSRTGEYVGGYNAVKGCNASGSLLKAANDGIWRSVSALIDPRVGALASSRVFHTAASHVVIPDYKTRTETLWIVQSANSIVPLDVRSPEAQSLIQQLRALLPPCASHS